MKPRPSPQDQEILNLLESLKSVTLDYPPELLARRRAALIEQLGRFENQSVQDSAPLDEEAITEMLAGLQHVSVKYPPLLLAKQRAAFLDQIAQHRKVAWWETFASAVLNWFANKARALPSMSSDLRRSLVVITLLVAAFAGIMIYGDDGGLTSFSGIHLTEREISQPIGVIPTATAETTEKVCTPDSPSAPSCLTHGFAESPDQTSWVSNTANSWIKIDMGRTVSINKVELDRNYSNGSTGSFTISVAQSDGRYKKVYDSKSDDFTRPVDGTETIQVSFEPVLARYVKVTVVDPGIAINEVRAFSVMTPPTPYQRNEDDNAPPLPTVKPSSTPSPTDRPLPTDTLWPTSTPIPTGTPAPTDTPLPTDTRWPTDTPVPTSTPLPTNTPLPTDTRWPTDTPAPTSTPLPADTLPPILPTLLIEYISP